MVAVTKVKFAWSQGIFNRATYESWFRCIFLLGKKMLICRITHRHLQLCNRCILFHWWSLQFAYKIKVSSQWKSTIRGPILKIPIKKIVLVTGTTGSTDIAKCYRLLLQSQVKLFVPLWIVVQELKDCNKEKSMWDRI